MSLSCAIISGVCAAFASVFGKLSGFDFDIILDIKLRYGVKILCFCLMILLNSLMWTFFVKALQTSKTAVEATAVSSAANYVLSGILGFIAFGEVTGLFWWIGISLIITGVVIISDSSPEVNIKKKKKSN